MIVIQSSIERIEIWFTMYFVPANVFGRDMHMKCRVYEIGNSADAFENPVICHCCSELVE